MSEQEDYVDYQYHNYNLQETADISHGYEDEAGDENQYNRQESQDSREINPISDRKMSHKILRYNIIKHIQRSKEWYVHIYLWNLNYQFQDDWEGRILKAIFNAFSITIALENWA